MCVVEQTAREGMMHRRGGWVLTERLVETVGKFLDDSHQRFVRAIAEELLYRVVPNVTTYRTGQEVVELVIEQWLSAALQVAEVARLLAIVVLQIIKDDKLSDLWLSRRSHVPNSHIYSFDEVRHLKRSPGRAGLRGAITAADNEVFLVVHSKLRVIFFAKLSFFS